MGKIKIRLPAVLLALVLLFPAQAAAVREVIPIGHTAGIRMKSEGVLVVRLDEVESADGKHCPAREAGLREGDIIVSADGQAVASNDALQTVLAAADGGAVALGVLRGSETLSLKASPCTDRTGTLRLGILARDSMAGIGTLTFADPETGVFGSLGHGVCDAETGVLLPLADGKLVRSTVESVTPGRAGSPGALQGDFSDAKVIGTVTKNTVRGIFGTLSERSLLSGESAVPVASRDEIQTGGILQGMSGSPVLQNGKLIGAVTHVLVDDPASGYAICIEDMLAEADSAAA